MARNLTFVSLLTLAVASIKTALAASSCVVSDDKWNLLAFNLGGKDYNAGTKDSWGSGSATDITTSGRPPFNTDTVTCYFAQFFNAVYVLGADSSSLSSIYIYDASSSSWSTQSVTTGNFDPSSFVTILDHDTNVFYALSKGELYSLDMGELHAAQSNAVSWQDVSKPIFSTDNYDPVMALGSNHIHFLDVPNGQQGFANIFVIHFSYWQPETQQYGNFPSTHGQTASVFLDSGVQQEFIFVPDDGSATYVINVINNSTQTLAGPTADSKAVYFAMPDSFVQLTSSGAVNYFSYNAQDTSANSAGSWTSVSTLASAAPAASGSASASGSGASATGSASGSHSATSARPTGSGTGTSSGSAAGASQTGNAAVSLSTSSRLSIALLFGALAVLVA